MRDATHGSGDTTAARSVAQRSAQVGLLLECFASDKAAGKCRPGLDAQLKSHGHVVLDTVVLKVNAKHKASVYDPRRVIQGTLTAALTWGVFGLLAGGLKSLALWAILGAICGGVWAYYTEHLLRKDELARIGTQLPAGSSALLVFVRTSDARSLLQAPVAPAPTTASIAVIDDHLAARVFAGSVNPIELPSSTAGQTIRTDHSAPTSMITVRYPDSGAAKHIASAEATKSKAAAAHSGVQVELVISVDRDGRQHVADPSQGVKAWARSGLISWGAFGVVVGALAGALGGGGTHGIVSDAFVTGIAWAVFGLVAGALYGLWAGRAVSARRLKGLNGLLAPGSSMLVAWGDGPLSANAIDGLASPGSQRLVLRFNAVEGGAVLEAA